MSLSVPANSSYSESDWKILSNFWHPIAFVDDIESDKPFSTMLLDVPLVAYRTESGIVVARDVCPHRGARLSNGWVVDGGIACPYHGFEFGEGGACQKLPFAQEGAKIPKALCLTTFQAEEKYGLLFVCLSGEPVAPLPVYPDLDNFKDDGTQQLIDLPMMSLNASAGRHTENFNDVAHLSFVHQGTFGEADHAHVPDYQVERHDNALSFTAFHVQSTNMDLDKDIINDEIRRDHKIQYPHAASIHLTQPNGNQQIIYDLVSPVTASSCRIFMKEIKNFDLDQPVEQWKRFEIAVADQDTGIVEALQPVTVPVDINEEFHCSIDAFSVAYRRGWKEYGLGA